MAHQPVVTVVVPNYNHGAFVGNALDSVFSQSWQNLDVLVVDDGSTDGSAQVLQPWAARGVRIIQQHNQGASAARNRGIELARGEYIAFLDADDVWPQQDMLESAVRLLDENPDLGWTFGDAQPFKTVATVPAFVDAPYLLSGGYYTQPSTNPERKTLTAQDLCNNDRFFIPTGTLVIRQQCFREVGGFDTQLKMFEDTDMWLRLLKYPVAFFPCVLLNRRVHDTNISHRRWAYLQDLQTLFERHQLAQHGVSFDFHAARAHLGSGREAWQKKAYPSACTAFATSLRHRWSWKVLLWYVRAKTAYYFSPKAAP